MPQSVRAYGLGDPGAAGGPADDPPGAVPVQPPAARGEEDRSFAPLADGQVDRSCGARGGRDGDDLAALARDDQGPVPPFDAERLDVGAGRMRAGPTSDELERRSAGSAHSFRSARDLGRISSGVPPVRSPGTSAFRVAPSLASECDDHEGDHAGSRPSRPSVWSSTGASEATGIAGPKAWPRAAWS
jgi:hypothetical protein